MMGFCEGGNEHSVSLKGGEFRDRRAVSFSKSKKTRRMADCLLLS
jgi:hypothetical protein